MSSGMQKNKQTKKLRKKIQNKNLLSGQKKLDINDTEIIFCILLPGRKPKILYKIKGNRSTINLLELNPTADTPMKKKKLTKETKVLYLHFVFLHLL